MVSQLFAVLPSLLLLQLDNLQCSIVRGLWKISELQFAVRLVETVAGLREGAGSLTLRVGPVFLSCHLVHQELKDQGYKPSVVFSPWMS